MFKWEDFFSRDIDLGPVREREDLEDRTEVFNGPFVKRRFSIDEPTYYTASLKLFGFEDTLQFNNFAKAVIDVYGGFFLKFIATPTGRKQQLVRIIGGIPQGKQIGPSAWLFNFTLVVGRLNTTDDLLPEVLQPEDDYYPRGVYYIPRYWSRNTMATKTTFTRDDTSSFIDDGVESLERVSVSRSGFKVAIAGYDSASQTAKFAYSLQKGQSAKSLPDNLDVDFSGLSAGSNEPVAVHISDSTDTLIVAYKNAGVYSYNYVLGSFGGADRLLNVNNISSMSVSDDGQIIFIGVSLGVNWLSRNGGLTWVLVGSIPGEANTSVRVSSMHSATKDFVYAVMNSTNSLIKINITTLAKETLTLPLGNNIVSLAASSDGRRVFVGMDGANGTALYSLDAGDTWTEFGDNLGQAIQVSHVDSIATDDTGNVALLCLRSAFQQAYLATVYYDATNNGSFTREVLADGLVALQSGSYDRPYYDAACGRYNWFVARGGVGLSQSTPDRIDPTIVGVPPSQWTPPPAQSLIPRLFQVVNLPAGTGVYSDSAKYEDVGYVIKSTSNVVYVVNLFDGTFTTLNISGAGITQSANYVTVDGANSKVIFSRANAAQTQVYIPAAGTLTITDPPVVTGGSGDPVNRIEMSDDGSRVVAGLFTYDDGIYNAGTVAISDTGGTPGSFNIKPSGLGGDGSFSQLYSMCISGDGQKIVAGLNVSKIAISNDGGLTFTRNDNPFGANYGAIKEAKCSYDGQVIFMMAGSSSKRLCKSNDGGATWTVTDRLTVRVNSTTLIILEFSTNTSLRYLSNDGSLIMISHYSGSSNGEAVYASEDFGVTWQKLDDAFKTGATTSRLNTISGNGENYLFLFNTGVCTIGRPDIVISS